MERRVINIFDAESRYVHNPLAIFRQYLLRQVMEILLDNDSSLKDADLDEVYARIMM